MKLLFSSSDASKVVNMRKKLVAAGIPCEVRGGAPPADFYPELWVEAGEDFRLAVVIFATAGRNAMAAVGQGT